MSSSFLLAYNVTIGNLKTKEVKSVKYKENKARKENVITKKQQMIVEAFEKNKEVEIIPARSQFTEKKKLNVAAYCRVSTYAEAQSGSFELQKQTYKEKIKLNPEWEFVKVYADQGASGTSINRRKEFKKMLEDCRLGKIDLILVKSISRFSRNQLDFISTYRELKALPNPVGILIEDMGLNTLDTTSEMILGMLSVVAQGESEQRSAAINWSIIERFKKGIPVIPTHNLLGYSKDKFGYIVIEDNEANVVKFIFKSFIDGVRAIDIAKILMESQILTVTGNTKWTSSSIYRILRNEKYNGDVMMQKTFTVDCFSHKSKKNNGERPMYLLKKGIPAIISDDEWEITKKLLKNPRKGFGKESNNIQKPDYFVSTIKSGIFKNFIVIDPQWSKQQMQKILSERS